MATAAQKQIMITMLEEALTEIKTATGVSSLSDIETNLTTLRSNYDSDPASVTDAQIDTAHDQFAAIKTPNLTSVSGLWRGVDQPS